MQVVAYCGDEAYKCMDGTPSPATIRITSGGEHQGQEEIICANNTNSDACKSENRSGVPCNGKMFLKDMTIIINLLQAAITSSQEVAAAMRRLIQPLLKPEERAADGMLMARTNTIISRWCTINNKTPAELHSTDAFVKTPQKPPAAFALTSQPREPEAPPPPASTAGHVRRRDTAAEATSVAPNAKRAHAAQDN
jgi:hypothetical protein